ncbi:MAG: cytochrome c-type biogenesis protein CcmH [Trueperaceae bacterium]|nr:cytochrome c-type biogenesis protein CcmH [Trueperaceae bacterium]
MVLRPMWLAVAVACLALVAAPEVRAQQGASAGSGEVQLESRVFEIARQLRCPTCVSESVADSSARISIQMRDQIQEQLQAGRSEAEILAFFQERYGDWILLEPPRRGIHLWVWWLPGIALAAGAGGLTLLVVRWTRVARAQAQQEAPPEEERARVRAALIASDEEREER